MFVSPDALHLYRAPMQPGGRRFTGVVGPQPESPLKKVPGTSELRLVSCGLAWLGFEIGFEIAKLKKKDDSEQLISAAYFKMISWIWFLLRYATFQSSIDYIQQHPTNIAPQHIRKQT